MERRTVLGVLGAFFFAPLTLLRGKEKSLRWSAANPPLQHPPEHEKKRYLFIQIHADGTERFRFPANPVEGFESSVKCYEKAQRVVKRMRAEGNPDRIKKLEVWSYIPGSSGAEIKPTRYYKVDISITSGEGHLLVAPKHWKGAKDGLWFPVNQKEWVGGPGLIIVIDGHCYSATNEELDAAAEVGQGPYSK